MENVRARAKLSITSSYSHGKQVWYAIYYPMQMAVEWIGPFRDKTDAESAAHVEAERRQLELDWE